MKYCVHKATHTDMWTDWWTIWKEHPSSIVLTVTQAYKITSYLSAQQTDIDKPRHHLRKIFSSSVPYSV